MPTLLLLLNVSDDAPVCRSVTTNRGRGQARGGLVKCK